MTAPDTDSGAADATGRSETTTDDLERRRLDVTHNEQIKLSAGFVNGLAIATIAIGLIIPAVFALTPQNEATALDVVITTLVCVAMSGALHLLAQKILGSLR